MEELIAIIEECTPAENLGSWFRKTQNWKRTLAKKNVGHLTKEDMEQVHAVDVIERTGMSMNKQQADDSMQNLIKIVQRAR